MRKTITKVPGSNPYKVSAGLFMIYVLYYLKGALDFAHAAGRTSQPVTLKYITVPVYVYIYTVKRDKNLQRESQMASELFYFAHTAVSTSQPVSLMYV